MSTVASVVIGLEAQQVLRLKGAGGEAFHSLFFRVVRSVAPQLSFRLHADDLKPFSVSPPLDGCKRLKGNLVVDAWKTITFRVGLLSNELIDASIGAFFLAMAEGKTLTLAGKPVTVSTVDLCGAPLAATSFERLLANAGTADVIVLDFLSPTTFKSGGMHVLFPEPRLVFSSLLSRWNAFSDVVLPQKFAELFPRIMVSSYNLRTELVHFSRYKLIGFKGRVEYRLPEGVDDDFRRGINALADFSAYCGVGAKTTMGMGQAARTVKCTKGVVLEEQ